MNNKRTDMQKLQGKLCVTLYEKLGDQVLPVLEEIYGQYGFEVGLGLKEKWRPGGLDEAAKAFVEMCNVNGLPSEVEMQDGVGYWTGYRCPFGIENTYRPVCEALMAMDRELFRAVLGVDKGRMEFTIDKCLAAGDECCEGIFRLL
jgi:hypothetical protein